MSGLKSVRHIVVFEKQGSFIHTYGNDAKVISAVFGYRTKYIKKRHSLMCGFPISIFVRNLLVVIDAEVSFKCDFVIDKDLLGEKQYSEYVHAKDVKGLSDSIVFDSDRSYLYYLDNYDESFEINSHNDGCAFLPIRLSNTYSHNKNDDKGNVLRLKKI